MSVKENIIFVDDPVSNVDLVLLYRKLDEADIEWGNLTFNLKKIMIS